MNSIHFLDMTGMFLLALVTGGMFFFAAIMTPLVFTKLPPDISGPFIRQAFPVYSAAMAGMTLAAALVLWNFPEAIYLLTIVMLFLWAWLWLTPRINHYRDEQLKGNTQAKKAFNSLHRLSVGINLIQMGAVGFILFRVVAQI
ncbi:MAG: DUF4149 domain-containing protein [Candidatus Nitrohelix vancouverensis]|uniref:DUF4149 domain-containing protein n=1 Tax=Candidatus Nitrohelix vancouverensis TaxID=2705534 RepID=A0A7T0C197_9BACT|nr:MAG: DUF4149 domain-containing protein [Candidatus Nitrohelix vancouverensis]